jgi:aspartate aminotransferase
MKLSHLSETLIGSEIVKLGGEIREKIRNGETIYNFTVGDFDPSCFPIPKELEDEIVTAYRQHFTNYPAAEGNLDLRESIIDFIKEKEGLEFALDEVLVSAGGRPLIYALFRAVCDRDDKVIYAVPSWNNNHYTHFVSGQHIVIEAKVENNFMPTAEEIRPFIKSATLLSLCSPQNPTGTTFRKEELTAICDMVLEENTRRGDDEKKLYMMYDQMYWHLTYGNIEHYDPVNLRPQIKDFTIYIDAISKSFAATGVRVGWALGPKKVIAKMRMILTHVGAWAPMAEQKAVAKYLKNSEAVNEFLAHMRAEIEHRLREIYQGFQNLKNEGFAVDAIAPEAAIYLTIQLNLAGKTTANGNLLNDQEAVTSYILNEAKLAVVPFYAFGSAKTSNWYRLSVGTCKKDETGKMLSQLKTALNKLN